MSLLRWIALLFSIAIGAAPAHAAVVDHGSISHDDRAADDFADDFADDVADDVADDCDDDDDDERGLWVGGGIGHTVVVRVLEGDEPDAIVLRARQRLLRPPR